MAITTIKTTYSLDVHTVRTLERMARRWKVSKSEALRRAIRLAAEQRDPRADDGARALDELQQSLALSREDGRRWERQVGLERRASSRGLESK
jgi:hypothetical protein